MALCWGWIDAIRYGFDEAPLQRYTPRRPKSIWSQINREHVQRLIDTKQMTPHGLSQVEAAKRDGRWDRAYRSGKDMATSRRSPGRDRRRAQREGDAGQAQRAEPLTLAFRTHNMKTEAGRKKKIETFVEMLKRGGTIYPQSGKR